ncbi:hypothetical protein AUJ17_04070 [Candidatus Micrarchaeota archaeon CG1_02_47_40]|nr:MAG: hypothetical protein AUJ17_04070 [Candidatus Micrarchaeota archaeon CG1_02_47_40]QBM01412.1 hypothetical protein [uncultured archaeon]
MQDDIHTGVDALIEALKRKKVVELPILAGECGMGFKEAEKWARALEGMNLAEIQYKLTKTYIIWKGKEVSEKGKVQEGKEELEREEEMGAKQEVSAVPIRKEEETPARVISVAQGDSWETAAELLSREKKKKITAILPTSAKKLHKKIEEIEREQKKIAQLKGEKEKLLAEVYLPLEAEVGAQVRTISERLIEIEKNMLELQEKALSLAPTVEGMEGYYLKLSETNDETRKIFGEVQEKVGDSLSELRRLQEDAQGRFDNAEKNLIELNAKSAEINRGVERIQKIEAELHIQIEGAKERIRNQMEKLEAVEEALFEMEKLKEGLIFESGEISTAASGQKENLKAIALQIEKLPQMEGRILSQLGEYSQKVEELEKFNTESQKEFDKLREAVETNFAKMYLEKLKEAGEENRFEAEGAKRQEENIDMKIAQARKRIEELFSEGEEVADSVSESLPEVEGEVSVRAEEARGKGRRMLQKVIQLERASRKMGEEIERMEGAQDVLIGREEEEGERIEKMDGERISRGNKKRIKEMSREKVSGMKRMNGEGIKKINGKGIKKMVGKEIHGMEGKGKKKKGRK